MNRTVKKSFFCLALLGVLLGLSGCASLLDEDPNEAQLPWATPADWEGQVPGMPTRGY